MDTLNVREMIKALMDQGFSESAIAYGANVNKSTISRIVTGKTLFPRQNLKNCIQNLFLKYESKIFSDVKKRCPTCFCYVIG